MISATHRTLAITLIAAATLAGCNKKVDETPAPADTTPVASTPTTEPAPMPMPATPAPTPSSNVSDLQLGTAVGADNRVGTPATSFGTKDTLYASVTTAANTTGKLGARWTYLGADGSSAPKDVDTQTKDVSGAAATTHEFHVSKPDGWPAGKYHVDITLDGNVVQSSDFDVR
ncbi:hypothetical protein [Lysobacter claricitrinus]|uniref:hypothetical protein n=1 Tax=Lysobacter claricitrinus TaxID=3367728 RepID=UPI0037DAE6F9